MRRASFFLLAGLILFGDAALAGWKDTGFLQESRRLHTATLLPSGDVLVVGGNNMDKPALASAEIYVPSTGRWTLTGSLHTARREHTATLLPSGKVLIAGGLDSFTTLASAEIYDPATGVWTQTSPMSTARTNHTAMLLPSGKVLVMGGESATTRLSSAEIYDPATGAWSPASPMTSPRTQHTATRLRSGKILVAGGWPSNWNAEIYDPASGTWSLSGNLLEPRTSHTATLLPSGKVLVTGGNGFSSITASAEIYDPATGTWQSAGAMTAVRSRHCATLLPSGKVLVASGSYGGFFGVQETEIYDPVTGTWTLVSSSGFPSMDPTATLLPDGSVLFAGGLDLVDLSRAMLFRPDGGSWSVVGSLSFSSVPDLVLLPGGRVLALGAITEIFDPEERIWLPAASPAINRSSPAITVLSSGKVLVAGGGSAEIYDPLTGLWERTGPMSTVRSGATATLLPSGKVLVVGGSNDQEAVASAELYDPATGAWEETASLAIPRFSHSATLLLSGNVLVAGGAEGFTYKDSAELYDPTTGTWQRTGLLRKARSGHTASLLPSGKVLVIGGVLFSHTSAELYDPATGGWTEISPLPNPRFSPSATLLPSGRVLVVGDSSDGTSVDFYDPVTNTWEPAAPLLQPRSSARTILLLSGEVLTAGGYFSGSSYLSRAEIYRPPDFPPAGRRPIILATSNAIEYGRPLAIYGTKFNGDSEASYGTTQSSPSNLPIVHLRNLIDQRQFWLPVDPRPDWWKDPATLTVSELPLSLDPGRYLLTVVTAGVHSEPREIDVRCSVAITRHPQGGVATLGGTITFSVATQGGRWFQWRRNGIEIPGATGPSYTTPPVGPGDSGVRYTVEVDSGCMSRISAEAALTVADSIPPVVNVVAPAGGEYWLLSRPDAPSNEVVAWTMEDNIRVCRAEVRLLYSGDGGSTYQPVPGGGLLLSTGPGGACRFEEQPDATSLRYNVPAIPPSGVAGSLYKVEVRVTDQAGLVTTARSPNPFFIVQPNPDSVRTLILAHLPRMRSAQGISEEQSRNLAARLRELAGHPRVQGLVVDLGQVTSLESLYQSWNAAPSDPERANAVLFGPGGLHEYLREELLVTYTGVRHLVLVGDDRIIPLARVPDRTGLRESAYVKGGDLTANGTTAGRALAADRYLTDDLLAVRAPVALPFPPERREAGAFLPDLAIGRLVETPDEIATTIATFISQDGVLDLLELDPRTGRKVLVTGYDFLLDTGRRIQDRWGRAFGISVDDSVTPVDGRLLSPTWGAGNVAGRRAALLQSLSGDGEGRPAISSLNGHATHFLEGVPGTSAMDIQGLPAQAIYGPNACGSAPGVSLAGALVYSIGCHGGLPVAGSCAADADHSLDLPQTFLARGAVAYLANTGYGWGLMEGVGYGERLGEIFTDELASGGTLAVGEAVRRAKLRYFLELPRLDDYDEKTLLQWTLFGLPMYAVRTGAASAALPASSPLGVLPEDGRERLGPVVIERQLHTGAKAAGAPPAFLTKLDLHFDLTAPGVYTKYRASGEPLAEGVVGCPAPPPGEPSGCYYTLNGGASGGTGTSDLPIQPYLVYDSRLSGTSQHGALWMGGVYQQEGGWTPVVARLASNGGDFSNHGSTPRLVKLRPRVRRRPIGEDDPACRPGDLETSSLVIVAGESLRAREMDPLPTHQRIYRSMDLEVLYFNDQGRGGNCDRTGPVLSAGPFSGAHHRTEGAVVEWAVPVSDEAGIWRVVVVYDLGPDAMGQGEWRPIELADDGTGTWRGQLPVPGSANLIYLVQAVDRHGNVSWLEATGDLPASGTPHGLPRPVDVPIESTADLAVSLVDSPDPVAAGGVLTYEITVQNQGPRGATAVRVTDFLPAGMNYLGSGPPWVCNASPGEVTCSLPSLSVGPAPLLRIFVSAPRSSGSVTNRVLVAAAGSDPAPGNNEVFEQTFVTQGVEGWIFGDGFEAGSSSAWSTTEPSSAARLAEQEAERVKSPAPPQPAPRDVRSQEPQRDAADPPDDGAPR